jgi:enamine deaminase RidA (YjgF/YER057c/UK114 family)
MIRKDSRQGIGYSVVDFGGVQQIFAAAVPGGGGDLGEQARDALCTIERLMHDEGARGSIVHQAIFMKDIREMETCRRIMKDFYGSELPATTYVPQRPCGGKLLEIEAIGVGSQGDGVQIERCSEQMVVMRHADIAWAYLSNVSPETRAEGVYERSLSMFQNTRRTLEARGFRYNQVFRTWLYLGDIVGPEADTQRYKELNRARTDFYRDIEFGDNHVPSRIRQPIFPASTGIGSDGRDVMMSSIALASTREDLLLVPLENPLQVSAFDYGAEYSPKSPKFARAMAVVVGDCAALFVSGTASITSSETQYVGDMEGQTWQTLDNIAALISEENLCRHGLPGLGATLDDMVMVRIYVKRQEDYQTAHDVCYVRLGELPSIFAIADVCRPELLVEIEGVAFSKRGNTASSRAKDPY